MFKNWREANINLNKELFRILSSISASLDPEGFSLIAPLLMQKIMESSFSTLVQGLLRQLSATLPIKGVVSQCLPLLKHAKQISEFEEFLNSVIDAQKEHFPYAMVMSFVKNHPISIFQSLLKKLVQY